MRIYYSGTQPYGHLSNTITSLLRPFFWPPGKNRYAFSCQKTLVNTATPLIRQNFFDPLVNILTGFHCTIFLGLSYISANNTFLNSGRKNDVEAQVEFSLKVTERTRVTCH